MTGNGATEGACAHVLWLLHRGNEAGNGSSVETDQVRQTMAQVQREQISERMAQGQREEAGEEGKRLSAGSCKAG